MPKLRQGTSRPPPSPSRFTTDKTWRRCRWVPAVTCHEHGGPVGTPAVRAGALTLDRGHAEIRPRPGKRDDPRSWRVGTTRRSSGARLSTCIGRRRVRRCEGSRRIWASLGTRCRCGCTRWTQSWTPARQAPRPSSRPSPLPGTVSRLPPRHRCSLQALHALHTRPDRTILSVGPMLVQPYAPDPGVSPLGGIWRRGDFCVPAWCFGHRGPVPAESAADQRRP